MARVIFNGEPGEVWANDTGRAQYQFVARLSNTCGVCIQYHLAISSSWPIPLHRGCRCTQVLIIPGGEARPFIDFRETIEGLGPDQQAAAVGASNWKLIRSGAVRWEDVVTTTRVRDLREVVSRQKLSVARMRKAGVSRSVAEKAYETVHTPAHELADRRRAELVEKLTKAGLSHEQIATTVGEKLAGKVRLTKKPLQARPEPRSEVNPEALAKALGIKPEALKPGPLVSKPLPGGPPPPVIQLPVLAPERIPGGPIGDRIKTYLEGVGGAKVKAISEAGVELETALKQLDELNRKVDTLLAKTKSSGFDPKGPEAKEGHSLMSESANLRAKVQKLREGVRAKVAEILRVDSPTAFKYTHGITTDSEGLALERTSEKVKIQIGDAWDWLSQVVRGGGKFDSLEIKVGEIPTSRDQRANCSDDGKIMSLPGSSRPSLVIHETAHAIEAQTGTLYRSLEFLRHRVGDEKTVKLNKVFPKNGYAPDEVGRKDRFDQAFEGPAAYYVGKDYHNTGTEILSMGMERLYEDPTPFARNDSEYCGFVLGILDGSLR